jgi:signal transduction histidine kinase/PAS domain-containing protein
METGGLSMAVIGLLFAAWLVAATVAIWIGLSLRSQANKTLRQTGRLGRLLETAPAIPVIVRGDGKLEAADRLYRQLGLDGPVTQMTDIVAALGQGKDGECWRDLDGLIRETQRTGKKFVQRLSLPGSDSRLMVVGDVADAQIYPNGAALLWFFDLSDTVRDLERLELEASAARAAFEALSGLIEHAPIPMWHRGTDLQLNFVNRAYVAAVGGENGDAVVGKAIELIEPAGGETAMSHAAKANEAGAPMERMVSSTIAGERRQLRVIDIPLGNTGIAGLAIDMQELVDARLDFRRLGDSQRDLLDKLSASVAQFGPDRTLQFSNLPFRRLFAFRDDWVAARPEFARVLDRLRETAKIPEVRDFPLWRSERENWFLSAAPVEENWLTPDGVHLRLLAQPTPEGGLILIFEDRTEEVHLASARDTLLRVRTATFDNLFEAIAVFAADGRLSIWNRRFAETWGVEEIVLAKHPRMDEILNSLAGKLKKAAQVSVLRELLQMTIANREPRRSKMDFADGRKFQLSTVPLPDGNALLAMLDITDSAQVEEALRDRNSALSEADSIKGRFLANMSYELRTPLTSISGFAEMLGSGLAGELSPQASEYVDAIAKSAERLSQQINTVLDFSQNEAGALPIVRKPVDVAAMLSAIERELHAKSVEKGVDIALDVQQDVGELSGDLKRLSQAISHILDNALMHCDSGSRVLLHGSGNRKNILIAVSDDGPGMDAGEQTRALNSVGRGANGEGGLGLPFAKSLVESHGGSLKLESQKGQGTTVSMLLPRAVGS